MFNQKLHSLQTHQHIHSAVDKKRRTKENVFQMLKMYTMHSTQLNAIIWLDATNTLSALTRRPLLCFAITQKRTILIPPSTRFIPRI